MMAAAEIYTQLCPFWDGEDGAFDLNTITETNCATSRSQTYYPHVLQAGTGAAVLNGVLKVDLL